MNDYQTLALLGAAGAVTGIVIVFVLIILGILSAIFFLTVGHSRDTRRRRRLARQRFRGRHLKQ